MLLQFLISCRLPLCSSDIGNEERKQECGTDGREAKLHLCLHAPAHHSLHCTVRTLRCRAGLTHSVQGTTMRLSQGAPATGDMQHFGRSICHIIHSSACGQAMHSSVTP